MYFLFIVPRFSGILVKYRILGGFSALTATQFEKFPASCHKLQQLVGTVPDNSEELANATRDALRDVSQQPNLCQLLRRKTEIRVLKQVELIDQLKKVLFYILVAKTKIKLRP